MDDFYRPGHRALQDQFDSRRLADRLGEITVAPEFSDRDREMIERAPFFWLATSDTDGWPDVSYKGGRPGFVRVLDDTHLLFPSYDGNGMFRSLGNILDNPKVGLLFCDFDLPWRVRVKGTAEVLDRPDDVSNYPGAELVVQVTVDAVFPNCSRYLHKISFEEVSPSAPAEGYEPPEAEWKSLERIRDYLPGTEPT